MVSRHFFKGGYLFDEEHPPRFRTAVEGYFGQANYNDYDHPVNFRAFAWDQR
jgi:hypothetical protein